MMFLAPLLLGGLVFASAPLIIHLLNRRQFKLVEWAPMEYLKLTLRTNRRRLQLEQWILLALRTLLILLLIFAVARPLLNANAGASWLAIGGRTSRVLVIDDSLSMGLHQGGTPAFDRAKEEAAVAIESLGTQDSLTVVTTSRMSDPLQRDTPLTADQAQQLADDVRELEPSETANNWAATLAQVVEMLEGAAHTSKEVRIITDQRAEGWSADASEQARRLAEMGVKVTIVNVGNPSPGNAALIELEQTTGVALANTPVVFTATIRADGDPQWSSRQATLIVDGNENPLELPDLAPNQEIDLPIEWSFKEAGQHTIELRLPDDAMAGDNQRSRVVNVAEAVNVLLVDGDPSLEIRDGELFYFNMTLSVGAVPINTRVMTDAEWLDAPGVGFYDLIVLANVAEIPADRAQQLYDAVEAGTGLMVFMGDQVDPDSYNNNLYANGEGVLPGRVDVGEAIDAEGLIVEPIDGSVLTPLGGLRQSLLAQIVPLKTAPIELDEDDEDVQVLARWNNTDLMPAIVQKKIGRGTVLLWTMTADRGWGDWPTQGSFFIASRESSLAIAGVGEEAGNLTAGEPIRQAVSTNPEPSAAKVQHPGEDTTASASVDRDNARVVYGNTGQAGVYRLTWDKLGSPDQQRYFAVSPDARESDLNRLTESELEQVMSGVDLQIVDLSGEDTGDDRAGREIWRTLAVLLLAMVIIEACFATWVGREH
ncbi:BatA domain-containing protein [Phycisphaeraceae bacterium D3-23]